MGSDERFIQIAGKAIQQCDEVDCSISDYARGLSIMIEMLNEARLTALECDQATRVGRLGWACGTARRR